MRVMLDTNILISSFIFKSSKINELINELSKNHEIVICSYVIDELKELILSSTYDAVINCVGILNENAERNKSKAVKINSYLPHILSDITRETKTKIIQMSTDCVFSGGKGGYLESDIKDGDTFYDRSKALGEIINDKDLTFRNSIIGPDLNVNGIGLFNWFMKQVGTMKGYEKAIWNGVTTLTLAKAMEVALKENLTGLYHLVGSPINKFELLNLFNGIFKNNEITINPDNQVSIDKSLVNTRNDFNFNGMSNGSTNCGRR